jgi:hypothetical protein
MDTTTEKQSEYERINFIITIVKRGLGEKVIRDMRRIGVTFNMGGVGYTAVGHGLADYMGLTEDECDMVYSIVTDGKKNLAMSLIEYKYSLNIPGHGAMISIPVAGVGGPVSLKYISGTDRIKTERMKTEV